MKINTCSALLSSLEQIMLDYMDAVEMQCIYADTLDRSATGMGSIDALYVERIDEELDKAKRDVLRSHKTINSIDDFMMSSLPLFGVDHERNIEKMDSVLTIIKDMLSDGF